MEYHFPRHSHFLAADETFSKLMHVSHKIMKHDDEKITSTGETIKEKKKNLISSYIKYLTKTITRQKIKPPTLS